MFERFGRAAPPRNFCIETSVTLHTSGEHAGQGAVNLGSSSADRGGRSPGGASHAKRPKLDAEIVRRHHKVSDGLKNEVLAEKVGW